MNKFYSIAYKLYTINDGQRELQEEAPASQPFIFISGFSTTIPAFEKNIETLAKGDTFDFVLAPEEAYGEYYEERVIDLDKSIFERNGVFDSTNIYVDAIIPLQNADGNRFMGQVVEISDSKVKVDLNHPLAGCELNFVGEVVDCREATNEEIQSLINSLAGGGCHGGCGNCGGGCGGDCDGDCGCDSGCCK